MKELEQPLISIIVPVYKVEKYLKRCVDSILTQTYQNMEIILVDDGSPDNCGAICDRYKKTDNRVVVIHKRNGGLSDARNTAIPLAKGEYISFIDSDDWISSYYVEHLYEAVAKCDADIGISWFENIFEGNKNNFSVREGTSYIVQKGVLDKYSISFLNSISYTENCYHCQYANIMRVSDITLGDSWGSNLDIQEQRKGVSLILNQTLKGKELLEQSELELMDVELNRAIEHNHQLKHPSIKPNTRKIFFDEIKNGKNFNAIVRKLYPKQSAKQIVKMLLIKAKIMGV